MFYRLVLTQNCRFLSQYCRKDEVFWRCHFVPYHLCSLRYGVVLCIYFLNSFVCSSLFLHYVTTVLASLSLWVVDSWVLEVFWGILREWVLPLLFPAISVVSWNHEKCQLTHRCSMLRASVQELRVNLVQIGQLSQASTGCQWCSTRRNHHKVCSWKVQHYKAVQTVITTYRWFVPLPLRQRDCLYC